MGEVIEHRPQEVAQPTPAHMLQTALDKGLNPDQLGQFMDLYERWEANQARKAFADAMVRAHSGLDAIAAKEWNDQTKSHYAALAAIAEAVNAAYSREGLSLSFYEGETAKESHIRIMCDVMHRDGHCVTRYLDIPVVNTGIQGRVNMTLTHALGSATTYGRRYLTLMIANLPVGKDDDGNGPPPQSITTEQAAELKALLKETNSDVPKFLEAMGGAASVDELPADRYNPALIQLNKKLAAQRKAKANAG